jgi:hypothetical protein
LTSIPSDVAGVQREQKSQKLLAVLQETIKALVKEGIESKEPISYQHPLAKRLCTAIELILSFGLKGMTLLSLSTSID